MRGLLPLRFLALSGLLVAATMTRPGAARAVGVDTFGHGAVGSWYGKAVQVCAEGVAPSACAKGRPAVTLFMTPTLTSDGLFVADDSFLFTGAPFAPHTTAHGQWVAINRTDFIADYVFMVAAYPPVQGSVGGFRARWQATVVDENTLVGWVNGYVTDPVPLTWQKLAPNEFPTFPPEAADIVTPKNGFVKDPATCNTEDCPLVFKFVLKRVAP
jgi:hypothetical protein